MSFIYFFGGGIWGHISCAQYLLLALCSGIILDSMQGTMSGTRARKNPILSLQLGTLKIQEEGGKRQNKYFLLVQSIFERVDREIVK